MEPQRLLLGLLYCAIYLVSHLLGEAAELVTRGSSLLIAWILLGRLLLGGNDKHALRILWWVVWMGAIMGVGFWRGIEAVDVYAWIARALSLPWMAAEIWSVLHFFDSLRKGVVIKCEEQDGEVPRAGCWRGSRLVAAACLLLYCAALFWQMTVFRSLATKYPHLDVAILIFKAWSWLMGLVGLASGLNVGLLLPATLCLDSTLYSSLALDRTAIFVPLIATALILSYETIPNHFYRAMTPRWCRSRRRGKKAEEDERAAVSVEKVEAYGRSERYGAEDLPLLHSSSSAVSEQGRRLDGKLQIVLLLTANAYFLQFTDPLCLMLSFYAPLAWMVYSCFLVVRYVHRRRHWHWFQYHYYRLPPPATCPASGDVLEV